MLLTARPKVTPSDVRCTSSGTMSKLLRDCGMLYSWQCRDGWIVDQWQAGWATYVEHCGSDFETWMDSWDAYVRHVFLITNKRWTCTYRGEVDYQIDGVRYEVLRMTKDYGDWNDGVYDTQQLLVGSVRAYFSAPVPPLVYCAFPTYRPVHATHGWGEPDERGFRRVTDWQWHWPLGEPEREWHGNELWVRGDGCKSEPANVDWESELAFLKAGRQRLGVA